MRVTFSTLYLGANPSRAFPVASDTDFANSGDVERRPNGLVAVKTETGYFGLNEYGDPHFDSEGVGSGEQFEMVGDSLVVRPNWWNGARVNADPAVPEETYVIAAKFQSVDRTG